MTMMTFKKAVPTAVEKKFYEVKNFADSDITMSKGMFALGLLAAALGGMLIGIFISPKGAKVQNVTNNKKDDDFDINDINDFWYDDDEFEDEDDEETESNELNGNRSKFIKL